MDSVIQVAAWFTVGSDGKWRSEVGGGGGGGACGLSGGEFVTSMIGWRLQLVFGYQGYGGVRKVDNVIMRDGFTRPRQVVASLVADGIVRRRKRQAGVSLLKANMRIS